MTGGGFGGSTVTLARADKTQSIMEEMSRHYKEVTGIDPHIFSSQAVDGAQLDES